MKGFFLAVTVASSLALALAAGCGGSSSGGGAGTSGSGGSSGTAACGDVNCDYKVGSGSTGYEICSSYSGLPSSIESSIKTSCMANAGATNPSSCPTANRSGCCENIKVGTGSTGYSYGECYYNLPSASTAAIKSACTGTWTK